MMDIGSLDYSYSLLAAAAFCHFSTFDVVHQVSGRSAHRLQCEASVSDTGLKLFV